MGICWLIQQLINHRILVQLRQQNTWHISTLACCNAGVCFGSFPLPKAWGESQTGTPGNSKKRKKGPGDTYHWILPPFKPVMHVFILHALESFLMTFSECHAEGKGKKGGGKKAHLVYPPKVALQRGLEKIKINASWVTLFPQVF